MGSPSADLASFACLEDKFCKNFSCCGLELDDLHDLLQHFEECHGDVRLDSDEEEELFEFECMDEGSESASDSGSPLTFTDIYFKSSSSQHHHHQQHLHHSSNNTPSVNSPAAVALSDIYAHPRSAAIPSGPSPKTLGGASKSSASTPGSRKQQSGASPSVSGASTKARQSVTPVTPQQSPAPVKHEPKQQQQSVDSSDDLMMMDVDEEEPVSPVSSSGLSRTPSLSHTDGSDKDDRPYKCKIKGCSKAYKNPGGLKYHMQHGHCRDTGDPEMNNIMHKPYQCTVPDCGRRYKNLNGLKVCFFLLNLCFKFLN